jgi:hypothetical protein
VFQPERFKTARGSGVAQDDKPPKLLQLTTAEEVQQCVSERYPVLGEPITLAAAEQFLQQRPSLAGVVSASTYHDAAGHAVLLGDAAHSTGGSLGQVCALTGPYWQSCWGQCVRLGARQPEEI